MAPNDVTPTRNKPVFWAKAGNQRLVRIGKTQVPTAIGQLRTVTDSLVYEFEDHYLVVDDALRERDARYFKKHADLLEGVDTCPAEEWLRKHPKLDGEHGFIELDPVAPDAGPVLQEVAAAAIGGDSERLAEIYEEEEREWQRPAVLEAAESALRMLEEKEKPPQPAAT